MDPSSEEDRERVSNVLQGISHEARVALLQGLREEKDKKEIGEEIGMTRGGIHKHLEKMMEAELVYREEEMNYELTPLGKYWADLLDEESDKILAVLEELEEWEKEVRQEVEELKRPIDEKEAEGFTFQIDEKTWERTIQTQKWKRAKNEINEMIGGQEDNE